MIELHLTTWAFVTSATLLAGDLLATGHIVLFKRDNRAALGWVGLIWLVPVAGPVLYFLFGINRTRRKARRLRWRVDRGPTPPEPIDAPSPGAYGLESLQRLVGGVTGRPISPGNRVQPLATGEAAYTQMLTGIASAEQSIGLSTYIFDNDRTGRTFVEALSAAVHRGVAVRVLIDDLGLRYSFPSIVRRLRFAGVLVARFMPSFLPWRFEYAQLRNHRKILILDGRIGFTGGMNIRDGHDARMHARHPITDCHFRIDGPVVNDLRSVFADDWQFATGEALSGSSWFPELDPVGSGSARGIASGPEDDDETLRLIFLGALACARQSVRIVTPYFLPDSDLISALSVAALRGVRVDILVPEHNNMRLVHWAMMGQLGQLLEHGCRIWLTPPPFDHTKLFLIDEVWCMIGSANWDPRSLRLNFEFDLECYDTVLVGELTAFVEKKRKVSRPLTGDELNRRNLLIKLRNGVARLASPYL
jgi:cardiolipin synthase